MTKAEERARDAYRWELNNIDTQNKYEAFVKGYHQAEKDLALTIEDIKKIDNLMSKILYDTSNDDDFTMKCVYQEAMAMRWLRGKNIFIFPNPQLYIENGELKLNSYHVEIASNKTLSWETLTDEYKSYEDACEAAIKYSLENLI